ncbi:MAG: hypothetical protein K8I02_03810, partial [Candidatus Methylomirabilis sp.]|nr:hypothetical protein [Deltaproteobacteria bacterium]
MRVIEGLEHLLALDLPTLHGETRQARSAVTVGVFDGVHLGHLRLVHELVEMAAALDAVPTAITFRAHPDLLLRGAPEQAQAVRDADEERRRAAPGVAGLRRPA